MEKLLRILEASEQGHFDVTSFEAALLSGAELVQLSQHILSLPEAEQKVLRERLDRMAEALADYQAACIAEQKEIELKIQESRKLEHGNILYLRTLAASAKH